MEQLHSQLQACDLHKAFGSQLVLNGVNFCFDEPGVYAILGQNGAGKTTLIKCALGLEKVSSGKLEVLGNPPGSLPAKRRTGVMLQDSDLPDLLTVREQIQLFASYYPDPFTVEQTIELCALHEFADKRYKKLSGGQKRRAQFALAVVGDPDLIFLDEPTTGLDIQARKNLWAVIRQFAKQGKTIVLTTHYLEEADSLADQIIVLAQGKIVANAKPEQIHQTISGSIIRCQTTIEIDSIAKLPDITRVTSSGRYQEIVSTNVNISLQALLAADPNLSDLTVNQPKLEDIFTQLSSNEELAQ